MPIIVGGTNYYIESLLWDFVLDSTPKDTSTLDEEKYLEFEKYSPDQLYTQLRKIDPLTAERIHPNNKRKIIRALEVFYKSGILLSSILNEQRSKPGGSRLGGPLRYQHVILLLLQCNQEILNNRLDQRVDCMLEQGLLLEIRNFYEHVIITSGSDAFTKGVLQTIGFKEFFPYLSKFDKKQDDEIMEYLRYRSYVLSDDKESEEPEGLVVLRECLKHLKLVTQRYSKKQIKWVKNRFLACKSRYTPPIYALNTTNVFDWDTKVYLPAVDVIESYINESIPKIECLKPIEHPSEGMNEEAYFYCDICSKHFIGEFQWKMHLKSNKHKRVKDSQRRKKNLKDEVNTK